MTTTLSNPKIVDMVQQLGDLIHTAAENTGDRLNSLSIVVNREKSVEVINSGCCCGVCAARMAHDLLGTMQIDFENDRLDSGDAGKAADATGAVY